MCGSAGYMGLHNHPHALTPEGFMVMYRMANVKYPFLLTRVLFKLARYTRSAFCGDRQSFVVRRKVNEDLREEPPARRLRSEGV